MNRFVVRLLLSVVLCALVSADVWAQDPSSPQEVRPAVTSFWGDTGLWFVPTAEVLKPGGWAFGAYRYRGRFQTGIHGRRVLYPGTLAVGAGNRMEIFGAVRAVTSIDRDTRPLFAPANTPIGGVVNEYPFVREGWTGNNFGGLVGTKINLLSEHRRQPFALALRGTVKLPTAGEDNVGTGQFDYFADPIFEHGDRSQCRARGLRRVRTPWRPGRGEPLRRSPLGCRRSVRCAVEPALHDRAARRNSVQRYGAGRARHDRRNRRFDVADPHAARLTRQLRCGCDVAAPERDAARRGNEL